MKVIVPTSDIRIGDTLPLKGGTRYVASDSVAGTLALSAPSIVRLVADALVYTRPWRGESLQGKTLLIYRALGIGDEFMAARLCEIARRRYGASRVLFACFEAHHGFWENRVNPFELLPSVVPFDVWAAADYHVCGERWWELIATSDQPDCYRIMAEVCGIQIEPNESLPLIPVPPQSVVAATAKTVLEKFGARPLVLWQVAASSRIRSYPPEQTRKAMSEILRRTEAAIVAVGHPSQIAEYELAESDRLAAYSGGIPGMIALAGEAAATRGCVVAPDSTLGHIATAWPDLPVVSLWSAFDPRARVATYPNHRPIYRRIKCSPCWSHEPHGDPSKYQGCPLTSCNDYCAGMRAIPPAQIAEAVASALGSR